MTRMTTTAVMASVAGAGPFNSPAWRIGHFLQLVEGSAPYWLAMGPEVKPGSRLSALVMHHGGPDAVGGLAVMLGALRGDEAVISYLLESGFLAGDGPDEYRFTNRRVTRAAVKKIGGLFEGYLQLGVAQLDPYSLFGSPEVAALRKAGFVVTEFAAVPEPTPTR